jgi:hypothetical protein
LPWVRNHVAEFFGFDAGALIIARECVQGTPPKSESKAFDLFREIQGRMVPHGWRGVEFKRDSFIGDKLVDAGFPLRAGANLLKHVRGILSGRVDPLDEVLTDLSYALRMEVGRTITEAEAAPLLAELPE